MNNEEARFLLSAYRPDGQDASDPQFAEALTQAQQDPQLREWFETEQAFDAAVSRKVQSMPVPANLKESILAGRKTIRPAAWWTRRSALVAMAASIVALLCATIFLKPLAGGARVADYRRDITGVLTAIEARQQPLEFKSAKVVALQQWLSTNADHSPLPLPQGLQSETGIGCHALDWKGNAVLIACFRLSTGEVVHLAVVDRAVLRDSPSPGTVQYASINNMNTATWSQGTRAYVLASHADETRLHQLLKG